MTLGSTLGAVSSYPPFHQALRKRYDELEAQADREESRVSIEEQRIEMQSVLARERLAMQAEFESKHREMQAELDRRNAEAAAAESQGNVELTQVRRRRASLPSVFPACFLVCERLARSLLGRKKASIDIHGFPLSPRLTTSRSTS